MKKDEELFEVDEAALQEMAAYLKTAPRNKRTVKMEYWLKKQRAILLEAKPELRPRNKERQIKSRPTEKRRALAKSCKRAWDNAIQSGKTIKSENTYKINDLNNPADEYLAIAAQISDKTGSNVLIAGSSAVQFYSANSFLNTKLELIAQDADKIKATLQDLGFKTDAEENWYVENSVIQIALSASEETKLYQDVNKIITPYGLVRIVKIEDILLQRIIEGKDFWSTSEWAEYLLFTHYESVNMNYLKEQAALLGCLDNFTQLYKEVNFVRNNSTRELFL